MNSSENQAQNASTKVSEIMEQLKAELSNVTKAVQTGLAIDPLTKEVIEDLIHDAETLFEPFANTFTAKDRTRMVSGGIRNLGFIETANESAQRNPGLVPPYLNVNRFNQAHMDFTRKRALVIMLQQFEQKISDSMLLAGDTAYHDSLEYYNSVKEAARQRIPGAEAEFNLLSQYFKKSKKKDDDEALHEMEE
jgi:hypothetical protein